MRITRKSRRIEIIIWGQKHLDSAPSKTHTHGACLMRCRSCNGPKAIAASVHRCGCKKSTAESSKAEGTGRGAPARQITAAAAPGHSPTAKTDSLWCM
jgi:hypothetical protein